MCGVAGFMGRPERGGTAIAADMLARIGHRGPDDQGVWAGSGVVLGHVRLSILDPTPRGHQPFVTPDGLGVLSYNGEVYNFKELRVELKREGVAFVSDTDTEVVLHALHRWGPERAVNRLNGMFALAYFDGRDGTLWLARDRMGIKPLYVAERADALVFASEIRALGAHPAVTLQADEHAIVDMLLYERLDGTMTLFRGVRGLPPGALCRIQPSRRCRLRRYFDVLRNVDPARIVANAAEPLRHQVERLDVLLEDSVRRHMVSDVPLATMCSGGLDSGLVTALVRQASPQCVAYVADVEGMEGEEVRRAGLVCDTLQVELRPVEVSIEGFLRALPRALQHNEQPLFFYQGVAGMIVAEQIRRDGFKVVLTGDGADELFGGYDNHVAAYRMWRRRRLHAAWVRNSAFTRALGRLHWRLRPLDLEALAEAPLDKMVIGTPPVRALNVLLIDGARQRLRAARLFSKLGALERLEERAFLTSSFQDIHIHLGEYLRTTDRMSMSHSIENRVPFLENALIDFALHLPVSAKYSGGISKLVIKRLAEQRLPRELVHLPKIGFGMRPAMWSGLMPLLRGGRLAELLKWPSADEPDILALASRQRFYQFRLIAMELWLRATFHGETPESLAEQMLRVRHDGAPRLANGTA